MTASPNIEDASDTDWFTDPWARAWGRELQASEEYRQAAAKWEGALLLILQADDSEDSEETSDPRSVYLDLWHGECREARSAIEGDDERAKYAIAARPSIWKAVLNGELQPLPALAMGKLTLTQGNLASLLPFVAAARELVAAATRIETTFS